MARLGVGARQMTFEQETPNIESRRRGWLSLYGARKYGSGPDAFLKNSRRLDIELNPTSSPFYAMRARLS